MKKRKPLNVLAIAAALALLLPALVWAAYPAEVPRTGQTTCYADNGTEKSCADTGQDGDWLAGAPWPDPRFSERADGTVSDNLTGLVWAKNAHLLGTVDADNDTDDIAADGKVTWQHALDYIKKLNRESYLGHNDWRLPNVNELESLVHAGLYNPALPANPFTNVQSNNYWSSTSYAYGTNGAWVVVMYIGYVNFDIKTIFNYVWPVRAGQCGLLDDSIICLPRTGQTSCYDSAGTVRDCAGTGEDGDLQKGVAWPDTRFTVQSDNQSVTDNLTGLMWARNANLMVTRDPAFDTDSTANDGAVIWQHAIDYIKKLNSENYLNHTDWRLPNRRELRSLVDYELFDPALPSGHPFTQVQSYFYWSSSSNAFNTYDAWFVYMKVGFVFYGNNKTNSIYVWPVRSGQIITTTTTTPVTCAVEIFPESIHSRRLGRLGMFIVSEGDDAEFERGDRVDWGTDDINTILQFRLPRRIFSLAWIQANAAIGKYQVTVGDDNCTGTLEIK